MLHARSPLRLTTLATSPASGGRKMSRSYKRSANLAAKAHILDGACYFYVGLARFIFDAA